MLVVDPAKRITVAQIKQHRWMLADPTAAHQTLCHSLTEYNSNLGDYSEPVLGIMNTLGIDRQRTIEVTEQEKNLVFYSYLEILQQKYTQTGCTQTACGASKDKQSDKNTYLLSFVLFLSLCRAAATITSLLSTICCWRESESIAPSS